MVYWYYENDARPEKLVLKIKEANEKKNAVNCQLQPIGNRATDILAFISVGYTFTQIIKWMEQIDGAATKKFEAIFNGFVPIIPEELFEEMISPIFPQGEGDVKVL